MSDNAADVFASSIILCWNRDFTNERAEESGGE